MKHKEYLNKLTMLTHSPTWEAFVSMIEHHVDGQRRKLEQSSDIQEIYRAQGAVVALNALTKLKDEINGLRKETQQ
jgi:hypothetical protein